MKNFDLKKYLVENQLTSEENLEEGWKQAIGGTLIALGTLAGIGKIYAPKVGDSITSVDQNREALKAFNDALYGMSMRDSKSLDNLFRTIENSEFKDELKPSQAHYTSQGDSASLASSRLQSQVDALTQVIKANMDHFAISEKGTVLFMKDPESLQALEAGEKIRPVNDRGPELKEEKSKLKMKKSQLKEMIKAAFVAEIADPNRDKRFDRDLWGKYSASSPEIAKYGGKYTDDAFGGDDDLELPSFVTSKVAANVKNIYDVAEKMLEFLRIIQAGERVNYEEASVLEPILKQLYTVAKQSLDAQPSLSPRRKKPMKVSSLSATGIGSLEEENEDEASKELSADDILALLMKNSPSYMAEAEEEDVKVKVKVDDLEDEVDVDAEDTDMSADDEEVESKNDSIVIDKKIVSLSSLPGDTRKILDSLETLRAQAEEFGDQKFITQVGNTITFFTRDFVVAGDAPNPNGIEEGDEAANLDKEAQLELEEVSRMKKLAGLK